MARSLRPLACSCFALPCAVSCALCMLCGRVLNACGVDCDCVSINRACLVPEVLRVW